MPHAFLDLPQDVTDKIAIFQEIWTRIHGQALSRQDAVTKIIRSHMLRQSPWALAENPAPPKDRLFPPAEDTP